LHRKDTSSGAKQHDRSFIQQSVQWNPPSFQNLYQYGVYYTTDAVILQGQDFENVTFVMARIDVWHFHFPKISFIIKTETICCIKKGGTAMGASVVKIENLVKRYKELIAVDHINLDIREGEIFGLLGPNGSGKTTTINCLLSLLTFDKGKIEIFGKEMSPVQYAIKRDIGVIMQNVAVIQELTVYENIDYFCGLYIPDKKTRKQYVTEAIQFVGLEDFVKFYPKKLSGGLLRRLNIACGIAHKPKLIILDEPTVAVDPQSRNRILEGIQELNRNGATIIYTSHYMEEVEQICTRIAILDHGRKIAEGTKDELKHMIKNTETITMEVPDLPEQLHEAVQALPHVYETDYNGEQLIIRCSGGTHNLIEVLQLFQQQGGSFGSVYTQLPTLNDVFLEITGKALRDKEE